MLKLVARLSTIFCNFLLIIFDGPTKLLICIQQNFRFLNKIVLFPYTLLLIYTLQLLRNLRILRHVKSRFFKVFRQMSE